MNIWLGSLLASAAAACLVFILIVVPWTVRGFSRAELDVPGVIAMLDRHRLLAATGVIMILAGGVAALTWIRRRAVGIAAYVLAVTMLIALAASCIVGWWLAYAARLSDLTSPM